MFGWVYRNPPRPAIIGCTNDATSPLWRVERTDRLEHCCGLGSGKVCVFLGLHGCQGGDTTFKSIIDSGFEQ